MRNFGLAVAAALAAAPAGAVVTGSASATFVDGGGTSTSAADATLPASATQGTGIDAGALPDGSGEGLATATQTALGFSRTNAAAIFYNPSLGLDPNDLIAQTVFRESVTNTTGAARDYEFDVFLKDMFVEIYDFAGAPGSPNPFTGPSDAPGGRISYDIAINGTTIFGFVGDVFGNSGVINFDNTGGTDGVAPDGSVVSSQFAATPTAPAPGIVGRVDFADAFFTLDAGTFNDGDMIELIATMTAHARAKPFELGAIANIGDPNDLSASSVSRLRATGAPMPPVPLPATAWLLLSGVAAVFFIRRRGDAARAAA